MRARFGTSTLALLLAAVLVALICVISISNLNTVEARYLPTRSDKSEIETLKDIIRGLLVESAGRAPPASRQQQPFYQHQAGRPGYLERRSAEMSVSSSNGGVGDHDESEVGYLASPFESTGGFKPMSQRPDR